MRGLITLCLAALFAISSLAAQSTENKPAPEQAQKKAEKKSRPQPKTEAQKPEESKTSTQPSAAQPEPKPGDDKKELKFDVAEVAPVVTHHQITVNGNTLKYTATTGRIPIKRADGKIEAEMFFVAYTLDGADPAKRPLTFAFNGGPGSASIWLHMGALGPRRAVMKLDGSLPSAPYHIEDNPY